MSYRPKIKATSSGTLTDLALDAETLAGHSVEATGVASNTTTLPTTAQVKSFVEGKGYLTSHQSIKTLNTNNTTAQTVSSSEAIKGSGTINLHKVSKTGSYNDLLDKPTIPTNTNQTVKGNGTAFGANAAVNIVGGTNVTVTADTTNNKITIAATASSVADATTTTKGIAKLATGDMNGATHTDGVAVSKNHTHSQYVLVSNGTASNLTAQGNTFASQLTVERTGSNGDAVINFKNTDGIIGRMGFSGTQPVITRGTGGEENIITDAGPNPNRNDGRVITQPNGANALSIKTGMNGSTSGDTGIFRLSDDNAYIFNSSDDYYNFAVFCGNKTSDCHDVDQAAFAVLSNHEGAKLAGRYVATVGGTEASEAPCRFIANGYKSNYVYTYIGKTNKEYSSDAASSAISISGWIGGWDQNKHLVECVYSTRSNSQVRIEKKLSGANDNVTSLVTIIATQRYVNDDGWDTDEEIYFFIRQSGYYAYDLRIYGHNDIAISERGGRTITSDSDLREIFGGATSRTLDSMEDGVNITRLLGSLSN